MRFHSSSSLLSAWLIPQASPPERFGWLFTKQDTYRDPNMLPNLEALQRNVDTTRDLGFVKNKIDIKKYADLSIVQEAAKRLK